MPKDVRALIIEGPECAGKSTIFEALKNCAGARDIEFMEEVSAFVGQQFPLGTGATPDSEMAFLTMNGVWMERLKVSLDRGRRVLSDRGWISQIVYARTRRRFCINHAFDPDLFFQQEAILHQLYSDAFTKTAVLYVDIPPEVSLARLEKRTSKRMISHLPDSNWVRIASEEYRSYFGTLASAGGVNFRQINGLGDKTTVVNRVMKSCAEMGFHISL